MKTTKGKVSNRLSTHDMYFAAYLGAAGHTLIGFDRNSSDRRAVFTFEIGAEDPEHAKTAFFGGTATVNAMKYADAIRSMKSRLVA